MNRTLVRETGTRGRGVFARVDIAHGEIFETCPIIVLTKDECDLAEQTVLDDYLFVWEREKETGAFVLGNGALYNHSFEPNAVYVRDFDAGMMLFRALVDIGTGEEICVNYNGDPACQDPVWFEVR